jgi:hypothetical protein
LHHALILAAAVAGLGAFVVWCFDANRKWIDAQRDAKAVLTHPRKFLLIGGSPAAVKRAADSLLKSDPAQLVGAGSQLASDLGKAAALSYVKPALDKIITEDEYHGVATHGLALINDWAPLFSPLEAAKYIERLLDTAATHGYDRSRVFKYAKLWMPIVDKSRVDKVFDALEGGEYIFTDVDQWFSALGYSLGLRRLKKAIADQLARPHISNDDTFRLIKTIPSWAPLLSPADRVEMVGGLLNKDSYNALENPQLWAPYLGRAENAKWVLSVLPEASLRILRVSSKLAQYLESADLSRAITAAVEGAVAGDPANSRTTEQYSDRYWSVLDEAARWVPLAAPAERQRALRLAAQHSVAYNTTDILGHCKSFVDLMDQYASRSEAIDDSHHEVRGDRTAI